MSFLLMNGTGAKLVLKTARFSATKSSKPLVRIRTACHLEISMPIPFRIEVNRSVLTCPCMKDKTEPAQVSAITTEQPAGSGAMIVLTSGVSPRSRR